MLIDMNIEHIHAIAYNSEDNGIMERFNRTIMNAFRAALQTAHIEWNYWEWALSEATEKYNQLVHRSTGKSPQELWFQEEKPRLNDLHIFGQLRYTPYMSKAHRASKYKDHGKLVRYLGRETKRRIYVEDTGGTIEKRGSVDFHPYFSNTDPCEAMKTVLHQDEFDVLQTAKATYLNNDIKSRGGQTSGDNNKADTLSANYTENGLTAIASTWNKYTQPIHPRVTPKTANPPSRSHALRYPDGELWAKSIDRELDKIDSTGAHSMTQTRQAWYHPALDEASETNPYVQLQTQQGRHDRGKEEQGLCAWG